LSCSNRRTTLTLSCSNRSTTLTLSYSNHSTTLTLSCSNRSTTLTLSCSNRSTTLTLSCSNRSTTLTLSCSNRSTTLTLSCSSRSTTLTLYTPTFLSITCFYSLSGWSTTLAVFDTLLFIIITFPFETCWYRIYFTSFEEPLLCEVSAYRRHTCFFSAPAALLQTSSNVLWNTPSYALVYV